MRSQRVEVASPAFDDDVGSCEAIEDLAVEKLVAEASIERLGEAAFLGAAGRDLGSLRASRANPGLHGFGDAEPGRPVSTNASPAARSLHTEDIPMRRWR